MNIWSRLDAGFYNHPKVLALLQDKQEKAINVYIFSHNYATQHGTDGFIPRHALPVIHGRTKEAQALCDVGLWNECAGGWDIQSWTDYQLSSDEHKARKERAKRGAAARWSKTQADNLEQSAS